MFKFRPFSPSSSISYSFYSVNSVLMSLCTSSYISAINTEVRFHSNSSLRQINGSVSVWIYLFIYFVCMWVCVRAKNDMVFPNVSLSSYYGPWRYLLCGPSKSRGRNSQLVASGWTLRFAVWHTLPSSSKLGRADPGHCISLHHEMSIIMNFSPTLSFCDKLCCYRPASFMKSLWLVCSLHWPTTGSHRGAFSASYFLKFELNIHIHHR